MKLFHGSNVAVTEPQIITSNRTLDFGSGFYTTSDEKQAVRWAHLQTLRRRKGKPVISIFEYDERKSVKCNIKRFHSADKDWLLYVSDNRKGRYAGPKYDIVIGPVANDNTMPVINDFISGTIDERTALILLKPQKLSDQYAFLTWRGLSALKLMEVRYDE